MTRIHVLGGTGYAGSRIVREAAKRGHQVVSYSRSIPDKQTPGVEYRAGDVQDPAFLASAFEHTDVVISALSTHGGLAGKGRLRALLSTAAGLAAERGVRFGVMGGAGSLLIAPDGPRLVDTPGFPEVAKPESLELAGALDDLRANTDDRLDWFLISPAENFGKHAPGTARGHYRIGGDILLRDENGVSEISGDETSPSPSPTRSRSPPTTAHASPSPTDHRRADALHRPQAAGRVGERGEPRTEFTVPDAPIEIRRYCLETGTLSSLRSPILLLLAAPST